MGANSAIEWTNATWNPITGCTKVSAGCDNCYAFTLAHGRLVEVYGRQLPVVDTPENRADPFAVRLWPDRLNDPARWREPRMVFVNSMSDPWHVDVPGDYVRKMFEVMLRESRHTYQVLTKRPARALRWYQQNADLFGGGEIPAHIWMGTSVENQDAIYRVGHLRRVPAAVRFLSCEPLLGRLRLPFGWSHGIECPYAPWAGFPSYDCMMPPRCTCEYPGGIHWVICGGESGINYRRMNVDDARSLRDQCTAAGVPFFFKQVGGRTPKAAGRLLDGVEHNEFPRPAAEVARA